jgi:hypothetical protein
MLIVRGDKAVTDFVVNVLDCQKAIKATTFVSTDKFESYANSLSSVEAMITTLQERVSILDEVQKGLIDKQSQLDQLNQKVGVLGTKLLNVEQQKKETVEPLEDSLESKIIVYRGVSKQELVCTPLC